MARKRTYRILKVVPTSFFADYGCHVRILEEARILQALGHQVTICTYNNGTDPDALTIRRTMHLPFQKDVNIGSSWQKIVMDALLFFTTLRAVWTVRPDVIHAHLHEGALLGWATGSTRRVPLVFDFQGSLVSEMVDHHFLRRDGAFFGPVQRLERWIDGLPRAIITSTQHAADLLVREFACPNERIHVIQDRVNANTFRPRWQTDQQANVETLKAELGIPRDRQVIVYLGLLAEYQGISLLLHAAHQLVVQQHRSDLHFVIMGYPAEDYYRRVADQMGLTAYTTFTGRVPYPQASRYLALGDLAVSPKVSDTEGSGKLLNYMAMGLPTVAFDTPVSREFLGEHGSYAEIGNPAALAAAIAEVIDHAEAAQAQAHALRERAERDYAWAEAGRQIVQVYDQVCAQARAQ
ncbi:MAG: glycosyltransferase family 4 protein [Chloroflexi bacterium]|nr:glycosyltransferase family 4 protein [Chloroflexota bacterium]